MEKSRADILLEEFLAMTYDDAVERVANVAMLSLMKGTPWNVIFQVACASMCLWQDHQSKKDK